MNRKILILSIISIILFGVFVSGESSFSVYIVHPENNSILNGDFFIIDVITEVNANCKYIIDGGDVIDMEYTGGMEHSSSIVGIQETTHNLGVFCEDFGGNSSFSSVDISINLSDSRNFLLLENISEYEYYYSLALENSSEIINNNIVVYKKSDTLNFVTYYKFTDNEKAENFINDLLPIEKEILSVNDQNIYFFDDLVLGTKNIAWKNGENVIYIMAVPINSNTNADTPIQIIEYYLKRYSSDIINTEFLNKLVINNLNVSWDGFLQEDVENGENITETLRGGTTLKLSLEILNNYTSEENITLDDVFLIVIIKNIVTGNEFNSSVFVGDISSQEFVNSVLFRNLPNEDGKYEIKVYAYSNNDGNIILSEERNFFVDVEQNIEDFIELRNVSISKNEATCGENVVINANIFNGGDDNLAERVRVNLKNDELNIDLNQEIEDLNEGETINVEFEFTLIDGLENKQYDLLLNAEYDFRNGNYRASLDDEVISLNVTNCEEIPELPEHIVSIGVNEIYNVVGGNELIINTMITNLLNETGEFSISLEDYQTWAELKNISNENFTLDAYQTKEVGIVFDVNDDAEGQKTFSIIVEKNGTKEIKSVNVNIEKKPILISSFSLTKKQELTSSQEGKIEIKNDGNLSLNIKLKEETNFGVIFSKSEFSLLPGETEDIIITIPENVEFDIGDNLIKIIAEDISRNLKSTLSFNVKDTFCEKGEIGSLRITNFEINNNGEGDEDEWKYLDEINIDIDVENIGDNLDDIFVELGLYGNDGNKINELDFQNADEERFDLGDFDENDEETATFEFKVPADMEDGDYKLLVKAYSKDTGERLQCDDSSSDLSDNIFERIKIKEENDKGKYILFDNVIISPLDASCRDIITISGDVYNIGGRDQDRIKINLKSDALGINKNYVLNDLNKGDRDRINFEFVAPQDVKGNYNVDLYAEYEYKNGNYKEKSDKYVTIPLKIRDCVIASNYPIDNYEDEVIYLNKKKSNDIEIKKVGFFEFIVNAFKEVFGKY